MTARPEIRRTEGVALEDLTPEQRRRLTGRLYGEHRLLDGMLRLQYEGWVQPALTDGGNLRALVDAGLNVPMKKGFALRQALRWSYESVVQATNTYEDLLFTFGISYQKP